MADVVCLSYRWWYFWVDADRCRVLLFVISVLFLTEIYLSIRSRAIFYINRFNPASVCVCFKQRYNFYFELTRVILCVVLGGILDLQCLTPYNEQ